MGTWKFPNKGMSGLTKFKFPLQFFVTKYVKKYVSSISKTTKLKGILHSYNIIWISYDSTPIYYSYENKRNESVDCNLQSDALMHSLCLKPAALTKPDK